ncbi:pneumococcal-type histidine triad protein [Streptococcus moroccensis]|uniref:Histidine triad protein (Predicted protease) n=1 Tax=Streptococcus moroccensis TaxID=1451356 RepID=A0ABT9YTQ5_9STRE|nr:pneumococcal-type histidine triad protein [Streptococcus moroccensis]MDQ0223381.1 histidine triad protein (predicted protease) [Streptococcus moroccensis]
MKKKYILGSAAALLLGVSSYQMGRLQEQSKQEDATIAYTKEAGKSKIASQQATPQQISDKENIDAEQIVVKITDQGYVTSHGDHFHYYDGRVPFDAIISEELVMKDPNYVFKDSDVVNEVKDGYIIKVDGKYYLYLKDAKKQSNVRSKEDIKAQQEGHAAEHIHSASGDSKSTATGYRTDDGYVFDPSHVLQDLGDGFLVPHGDHTHYIPKSQLSASELAAANATLAHRGQAGSGEQGGSQAQPIHQPSQPSQPGPVAGVDYTTDDGFLFDGTGIQFHTATGIVVQHGNHNHFLSYDSLIGGPWDHLVPASARPSQPGSTAPVDKPNPTLPSQSNQPNKPGQPVRPSIPTKPDNNTSTSLEEKLAYLAKSLGIKRSDLTLMDSEKGPLAIWKHGDHDHVYILNDFKIGDKISTGHDHPSPTLPSRPNQPVTPNPTKPNQPEKPSVPVNPTEPNEPIKPSKPEKPTDNIEEKLAYLADLLGIKRSDLTLMDSEKGPLAIWKHGDHDHVYILNDLSIGDKIETGHDHSGTDQTNTDSIAETEAKRRYISETYNVPLEAIKVKDLYFVFNEPTQDYDPTHIHPYMLRRDLVTLPEVTGDPETDFENELLAIAKHRNIKTSDIRIENGKFVIPYKGEGHGHTHFLNIKAKDGLKAYLNNKLPAIQGGFVAGDFDKEVVLAKVNAIEAEAEQLYGTEKPRQLHRISQALSAFKTDLDELITNSTDGYLSMLDNFRRQHLLGEDAPTAKPIDTLYNNLLNRIRDSHIQITPVDKTEWVKRVNTAAAKSNTHDLEVITHELSEIQRFNDRLVPTATQYLDYFTRHVNQSALPNELREDTAKAIGQIYRILDRKPADGETYPNLVGKWVDLKMRIDIASVERKSYAHEDGDAYKALADDPHALRGIASFIDAFKESFATNGQMETPKTILEPYGQPLSDKEKAINAAEPTLLSRIEEKTEELVAPKPEDSKPDKPAETKPEDSSPTATSITPEDQMKLLEISGNIQEAILKAYQDDKDHKDEALISQLQAIVAKVATYGNQMTKDQMLALQNELIQFSMDTLAEKSPYKELIPNKSETAEESKPEPSPTTPPAREENEGKTPWTEEDQKLLLDTIEEIKNKIFDHYTGDQEAQGLEYVNMLYAIIAPIGQNYGQDLSKEDLTKMREAAIAFGDQVLSETGSPETGADEANGNQPEQPETPADPEPASEQPIVETPPTETVAEPSFDAPFSSEDTYETMELAGLVYAALFKFENAPVKYSQYVQKADAIQARVQVARTKADLVAINNDYRQLLAEMEADTGVDNETTPFDLADFEDFLSDEDEFDDASLEE